MTHKLMTQETPVKVMGLLGVALVSMSFMFAVTISNASFSQVYNPVPDALAPANVVAMLDNVSHSYAMFVNTNLVVPAQNSYALAAENIAFVGQDASFELASLTGMQQLMPQPVYAVGRPQVAGAYTQVLGSQ